MIQKQCGQLIVILFTQLCSFRKIHIIIYCAICTNQRNLFSTQAAIHNTFKPVVHIKRGQNRSTAIFGMRVDSADVVCDHPGAELLLSGIVREQP